MASLAVNVTITESWWIDRRPVLGPRGQLTARRAAVEGSTPCKSAALSVDCLLLPKISEDGEFDSATCAKTLHHNSSPSGRVHAGPQAADGGCVKRSRPIPSTAGWQTLLERVELQISRRCGS